MTRSRRTWLAVGPADQIVQRIAYCQAEYHFAMASGEQRSFPELNLRLKTDASAYGPERGKPVLLRAGMQGDRAQLIFSGPAELKHFVVERCEGGER